MKRKKIGEKYIRQIQHTSTCYYITIPIRLMKQFGWKERQKVVVTEKRGGFSVRDWKPRRRKREQKAQTKT